jgi:hypothetical protein
MILRRHLAALFLLVASLSVAAAPPAPFTEEALSRGLNFTAAYPQFQGYVGQGCGFVDLDSDGDPDIVIIGRSDGRIGIFENTGGGMFVDRSLTSLIPLMTEQEGFAAADYNADGLIDLYITQSNNTANYLMRNNGGFTFTNATNAAGVGNGLQVHTGASWGDYNNDGWPDLHVCNYGQAKALYKNNGNGTFTSQASSLGLTASTALSFQTVWSDYDRDGDVDLYLSNDRAPLGKPPNVLWRNDGFPSPGTFTDVSVASGAGVSIFSMGLGAGDLDNNLYPDYYVTNVNTLDSNGTVIDYEGTNPLLMNQGNGTFIESTATWAVTDDATSWAAVFFDWDNDGYKDLYVVNQFEPNKFYHCTGSPACVEMAALLGIRGAYDPVYNPTRDPATIAKFNAAVADVDGDGDVDLLLNPLCSATEANCHAQLFINHEGETRSSVGYRIVGISPNRNAIGAGVETTAGGLSQFYEIYAGGNGYLGQNELTMTVGLGAATKVTQTKVRWPSGGPTRTLTGLPAGHTWSIYPPARLCDLTGNGLTHADFDGFVTCFNAGFSAGCEMMDYNGNSEIYFDDAISCFTPVPADCNGNGTADIAEITVAPAIDANGSYQIDCCSPGPATEPNPVGSTLRLHKNGALQPVLTWTAPPVNAGHTAATAYDVFRRLASPAGNFGPLAAVGTTTYTDTTSGAATAFYLVASRNACGTSGEDPF